MSKQDAVYPRTAAQLERQYNFGRSFAEVRGIALDAQTHAVAAEQALEDVYIEIDKRVEKDENGNLVGKLHIGANQLTVDTDNFKLDNDGDITITGVINATAGGKIAEWDISKNSIFKYTDNYFVQFYAPINDTDNVLTVASKNGTMITDTLFNLKANGTFVAKGGELSNMTINGGTLFIGANSTYVDIDSSGVITIDGPWDAHEEIQSMLLMKFHSVFGDLCGLYVIGYVDDNNQFVPTNISAERI